MNKAVSHLWAVLALLAPAAAQGELFEELALRVASLRPDGQVVVDRGTRDLVREGDRVVLLPRNGPTLPGRVVEVEERTALVELLDPTAQVPVGTRGYLSLPKARRPAEPRPAPPDPSVPPPLAEPESQEWQPGMPLLGSTRAPRPSERLSRLRGRVYGAANAVRTLDSFSQSYVDTGADVDIDNVAGHGGTLRFWGEFNWSEETSNNEGTDLRVYELSYEHGGNRFQPFRWQVGRFLQRDMPEFGILDGAEIGYRRDGGDRFGISLGYLPELDEDLESGADLQVAAWYLWNRDVSERLQVGIGYQKTWHRFEDDRDLVVVKGRLLPANGWDFAGSVWVDFYNGDDTVKDESFEVTRANAYAGRRFGQKGGVELFYMHEEYPETLRREIPQNILPLTLLEAHFDRLTLHGYVVAGEETRWFTRLSGWIDDQREGGAVELGVEIANLFRDRSRTVLAAFDSQGLTSTVVGVRIEHGGSYDFGRIDMLYEIGFVHHEGFPGDRDDLLQHRLGALLATDLGGSWNANFFADATLWDDELSFGAGIYLQKHF